MKNQVNLSLTLINVFILSILLITIMMLDLSNFDDFFNYQYYFNTISDSQNFNTDIFSSSRNNNLFGSDIGFAYLLKIFSIFFGSYETMIKSVYIAFGLFLLFISVKKSRFIDIHTLSLLIFILSNRLYIDGAFNFTRSWFAMHFFAFALLSIYGEKKSTNQKFYFLILLLVALSIHFQGTIICSVLLIISYFIRLVSSKFLPQVAISILGAYFSINFILSRRFNTSYFIS